MILALPCLILWPAALCGVGGRGERARAQVCAYSYSIYLWHFPLAVWSLKHIWRFLPVREDCVAQVVAYMTVSIVFGIVVSKLIEQPVPWLRDDLFPAQTVSQPAEVKVKLHAAPQSVWPPRGRAPASQVSLKMDLGFL